MHASSEDDFSLPPHTDQTGLVHLISAVLGQLEQDDII